MGGRRAVAYRREGCASRVRRAKTEKAGQLSLTGL